MKIELERGENGVDEENENLEVVDIVGNWSSKPSKVRLTYRIIQRYYKTKII